MGFLDSTSAVIDCILTRKGRELLARNDGSFRITQYAFGDDEINYQLYNLALDDDTDILNLPVLEPSSNDDAALRYQLITLPKGSASIAIIVPSINNIILNRNDSASPVAVKQVTVDVQTINGYDTSYSFYSENDRIAKPLNMKSTGDNTGQLTIVSGDIIGTTFITVVGNNTGAVLRMTVTVVS